MVTVSIMVILLSVVLVNFGGLSKARNLNIARNITVSDIRRAQSMALASRNLTSGAQAGYYGLTFSTATPTQYQFVADSSAGVRQPVIVSTNLPATIILNSIRLTKPDGTIIYPTYLEILFKSAFGRTVMTYSGGGASGTKESDDVVRITYSSTADPTATITIDINGTTGNVNQ